MTQTITAGAPLRAVHADALVRGVVRAVADDGTLRLSDGGLEVRELLAGNTVLAEPRARLLVSPSAPEVFNPGRCPVPVSHLGIARPGDDHILLCQCGSVHR